ncbi:DJ-1/PfpI family protein [Phreatobacter stygius]|uniref:Glutamine amidotransferase n=1 Tax=Phreatobacter stygius TaxID=1940610 RepID=A0A4D7B3A7_9HYPH|nr:DJ-1/PfpI family protein [Phreatobacter stygius]QCI67381.1 glutamine amidotransferase [Phreatobacter stygius]
MTTIVTILADGFADWETALLNAAARSFYRADTRFVSPGGKAVVSMAGMTVQPGMAVEDLDCDSLDALVVAGGTIWQSEHAPDISAVLRQARAKGKLVAGICDGTLQLAKAGLLDDVAHTSNGAGYLDASGYAGKARYRDVPFAVADGHIITAPGTAPVTFMAEVMRAVGLGDEELDSYIGMHAAEHRRAA